MPQIENLQLRADWLTRVAPPPPLLPQRPPLHPEKLLDAPELVVAVFPLVPAMPLDAPAAEPPAVGDGRWHPDPWGPGPSPFRGIVGLMGPFRGPQGGRFQCRLKGYSPCSPLLPVGFFRLCSPPGTLSRVPLLFFGPSPVNLSLFSQSPAPLCPQPPFRLYFGLSYPASH